MSSIRRVLPLHGKLPLPPLRNVFQSYVHEHGLLCNAMDQWWVFTNLLTNRKSANLQLGSGNFRNPSNTTICKCVVSSFRKKSLQKMRSGNWSQFNILTHLSIYVLLNLYLKGETCQFTAKEEFSQNNTLAFAISHYCLFTWNLQQVCRNKTKLWIA